MDNQQSNLPKRKNSKINLSINYQIIIAILLLIIAVMLAIWQPWDNTSASDRTITVVGESSVKSEPDEYVFYPVYTVTNADEQTALNELNQKTEAVVAELNKLGVEDKNIKVDTSGYATPMYIRETPGGNQQYSATVTVSAKDKDQSQKILDYLNTTAPSGSVTPVTQFSDTKHKELEDQARTIAVKDAKKKADQMASELGFKLAGVKSVDNYNQVMPVTYGTQDMAVSSVAPGITAGSGTVSARTISLQPGQNELNYSFNVVYYIK